MQHQPGSESGYSPVSGNSPVTGMPGPAASWLVEGSPPFKRSAALTCAAACGSPCRQELGRYGGVARTKSVRRRKIPVSFSSEILLLIFL